MTAPNEQGHTGQGEGNGDGPAEAGRRPNPRPAGGAGDAAPWHRGAPPPRQPVGRPTEPPEPRATRHLTGTAAPGADRAKAAEPNPVRQDRAEAYGSELPDLSGATRRPARPAVSEPKPAAAVRAPERRTQVTSRGPLRASMQIRRIDPWSTLKVSLILSVALFFVWMIAVAFLYLVLGSMGVWSKLNTNVGDLLNNAGGGADLVSASSIFGGATLIGLVNIVLLTAMATVGALIYNLTTDLIGGVEVTLADRD